MQSSTGTGSAAASSSSSSTGPAVGNTAVRITVQFTRKLADVNDSFIDLFFTDVSTSLGISKARLKKDRTVAGGDDTTLVSFLIVEAAGERMPTVVGDDFLNQTADPNSPFRRSGTGQVLDVNFTPIPTAGLICAENGAFAQTLSGCATQEDDKLFGYERIYVYVAGAAAVVVLLIIVLLICCCCCTDKGRPDTTSNPKFDTIELHESAKAEGKRSKSGSKTKAFDLEAPSE
jgi:hypothetical protein